MNGVEHIAAERHRQIDVEGYDLDHDAEEHGVGPGLGDLTAAAQCYALFAWWQVNTTPEAKADGRSCGWTRAMVDDIILDDDHGLGVPVQWPWDETDWKPSDDPVRNLEKAGALIAAEIDRILISRGEDLDPVHVFVRGEDDWSLEHPYACRFTPGKTLHDCEIHRIVSVDADTGVHAALAPGRYTIGYTDEDNSFPVYTRIDAPGEQG